MAQIRYKDLLIGELKQVAYFWCMLKQHSLNDNSEEIRSELEKALIRHMYSISSLEIRHDNNNEIKKNVIVEAFDDLNAPYVEEYVEIYFKEEKNRLIEHLTTDTMEEIEAYVSKI